LGVIVGVAAVVTIEYVASATELAAPPRAKATALTVVVDGMFTGPVYSVDPAPGVVPFVVYRMDVPGVGADIVTETGEPYTPAGGFRTGWDGTGATLNTAVAVWLGE